MSEEHSSFPQDFLRNIALSTTVKSHEKLSLFYQLTDELTLDRRLRRSDLYVTATISVRTATGYGLHVPEFESQRRCDFPHQPLIQCVPCQPSVKAVGAWRQLATSI